MEDGLGFDLHALRVIHLVCQERSMTQAAQRLNMTQPAVSHVIKQLESSLGVLLIDRRCRPLTPTTAGHRLAEAATRILNDAQQVCATIRQLDRNVPIRLRIGMVESLTSPFVPELVGRLRPSIEYLSLSAGLASRLREGLLENNLDLIITNDPMEDVTTVTKHTLLAEPYVLALPNALDIANGELNLPELCRRVPLIRWSRHSYIWMDIERHLRRLKIEIPRQYEFDSAGSILGMVAAGLGWAIVTPLSIFELMPLLSKVRIAPFPGPGFSRRLSIVHRAGEIEKLAARISHTSETILRERYLPAMLRAAPWLADKITTKRPVSIAASRDR
jgi:DNA-binding transcriptional LysR family regulator